MKSLNNSYVVYVTLNNGLRQTIECKSLETMKTVVNGLIDCMKNNAIMSSGVEEDGFCARGSDISWIRYGKKEGMAL